MRRVIAWALVAVQLGLVAALALIPRGTLWPVWPVLVATAAVLGIAGLALAALGLRGLGPALTASPIPRERTALVTSGVYGWMRHPVYSGLLVIGVALAIVGASAWHIAAWGALLVVLTVKSTWEERMLRAEHPEYGEYAARVGRFFPRGPRHG